MGVAGERDQVGCKAMHAHTKRRKEIAWNERGFGKASSNGPVVVGFMCHLLGSYAEGGRRCRGARETRPSRACASVGGPARLQRRTLETFLALLSSIGQRTKRHAS